MYQSRLVQLAAALTLSASAALAQPAVAAVDAPREQRSCFYLNQIRGQHALDDRSVLFRVGVTDIYKLTFAHECSELKSPDPKLIITPFGGNSLICRGIDLDVKVGQQGPYSFAVPCITDTLSKLTPDEIAAIPKKKLP